MAVIVDETLKSGPIAESYRPAHVSGGETLARARATSPGIICNDACMSECDFGFLDEVFEFAWGVAE